MAYIVGIDGGGTKTAVTVARHNKQIVATFVSDPINYNGGDRDTITGSFATIFHHIVDICGSLDAVDYICIGAAGLSNPEVKGWLQQHVIDNNYTGPLTIIGDQEVALYGAHNNTQGIILIAGTGSICFGVNENGEQHRSGGFGHLIDDEGSGYSIGRSLLSIVVQVADSRLTDTIIPEMVYEQLGVRTVQDIIGFVYHPNTTKKDIAKLAPIMTKACEAGDKQALVLADYSAQQLYKLVVPVIERLNMADHPIAIAGSVLLQSQFVRQALEQQLLKTYPNVKLIEPIKDAAYGAVLMGVRALRKQQV
ncbi:BadF/BadG/BcrA/BcrD ATPase family protein [Paenibacillus yanchengensis]|uniref:BadF/BadG/BcrA/BcrD ATPase family protein n=1 Tax=Paenibacillus yanchengensis TaxID=2035833 RepID=A0ABW4YG50_9BACL